MNVGGFSGAPVARAAMRAALLALVAALSLAVAPRVALAADTVIGFDDQPGGTVITNQYSSLGVTFDQSPTGPFGHPPTVQSDPTDARSPPNALNIMAVGGEFSQAHLWAAFAAPRNHVTTYIGNLGTTYPAKVTMKGYDLGGNAIPAAAFTRSFSASTVSAVMAITDPNSEISYVEIVSTVPAYGPVAIDDFSFDAVPAVIPPDFGLSAASSTVDLTPGTSSDQTLTLHRDSTSSGPISLSISGLPSGVTASFGSNPATGGDGSTIGLTLTAAANTPGGTFNVTVTGTPSSTAGSAPRSVTFQVSVIAAVEFRAQGIDVTQGVLDDNALLVPSGTGASGLSYRGFGFSPADVCPDPNNPNDPILVSCNDGLPGDSPLVEGNRTIVRVYADAHGAPPGGVGGVEVQLFGTRNGAPLVGSPLLSEYGPTRLTDTGENDPAPVLLPERISDANAYTFTLPTSWTQGTIDLTARLTVFPTFGPPYAACTDPSCQAHMSFALNDISFVSVPWVVIATLDEAAPGDQPPPASPLPVYRRALLTEPGANQFAVLPYVGTIDPTPQLTADAQANSTPFNATQTNPCPGAGYTCHRDSNNDYLQAVFAWGSQNLGSDQMLSQPQLPADILSGVNTSQNGSTPSGVYNEPLNNPAPGSDAVQGADDVNARRPLSSVAHETGHALGRNHADDSPANGQRDGSGSTGCGGNGGPWSPDGLGYLQGIGLDTSVYPYRILYPKLPGGPGQWYDKMSYCATITCPSNGGTCFEPNSWISPFGWLHSISALYLFGQRTGRGPNPDYPYRGYQGIERSARRARAAMSYGVTATISSGGSAQIDSVIPTNAPMPSPSSSPVTLVARGASGQTIASVPMSTALTHDDYLTGNAPGPAYLIVRGSVPTTGVDSVQIVNDGTVVATRTRSTTRPKVKILAPASGAVVGKKRTVTLRWKAKAVKGDILTIAIAYSADNGRRWRGIYLGPNRGQVRLPSAYFSRSTRARIRITVNDGFNQVQALSRPFRALGTPPTVSILEPASRQTFPGDATIDLHGVGFDDTLAPLLGRRLHWLVNHAPLGTGATISATALPPGTDRITLKATDRQGRTSSASVVIHIEPVTLPFLRLTVPGRLSASKSRLTLRAASALPTTLTVGHHHYGLTRKARKITTSVPNGHRSLLIRLTVRARGITFPITLVVRR